VVFGYEACPNIISVRRRCSHNDPCRVITLHGMRFWDDKSLGSGYFAAHSKRSGPSDRCPQSIRGRRFRFQWECERVLEKVEFIVSHELDRLRLAADLNV
jgi:hypothetical protein